MTLISISAFAGSTKCKIYLENKKPISTDGKDSIGLYELADLLIDAGHSIAETKKDADIQVDFGLGEVYNCGTGINSNFEAFLNEVTTPHYISSLSFKKIGDKWHTHREKYIYRNASSYKVKRKFKRMIKKLPKCN